MELWGTVRDEQNITNVTSGRDNEYRTGVTTCIFFFFRFGSSICLRQKLAAVSDGVQIMHFEHEEQQIELGYAYAVKLIEHMCVANCCVIKI